MKKSNIIWGSFIFLVFLAACSKDESVPNPAPVVFNKGSLTVNLNYSVDGSNLEFDTIKYFNESGNHYSVSRLNYYISNIVLNKSDGSSFVTNNVQYVDARTPATNQFTLSDIPYGNYTSVSFNIGLDSLRNCNDGLPNTMENINMQWPEPMGGGYHFLKLEGYFTDTCCTPGYAMHMGTNDCLVHINHPENFSISSTNYSIHLTMNVNEWFKNPEIYDFNMDGNYTMGNMMAMMKLAQNGSDIFNQ